MGIGPFVGAKAFKVNDAGGYSRLSSSVVALPTGTLPLNVNTMPPSSIMLIAPEITRKPLRRLRYCAMSKIFRHVQAFWLSLSLLA